MISRAAFFGLAVLLISLLVAPSIVSAQAVATLKPVVGFATQLPLSRPIVTRTPSPNVGAGSTGGVAPIQCTEMVTRCNRIAKDVCSNYDRCDSWPECPQPENLKNPIYLYSCKIAATVWGQGCSRRMAACENQFCTSLFVSKNTCAEDPGTKVINSQCICSSKDPNAGSMAAPMWRLMVTAVIAVVGATLFLS